MLVGLFVLLVWVCLDCLVVGLLIVVVLFWFGLLLVVWVDLFCFVIDWMMLFDCFIVCL